MPLENSTVFLVRPPRSRTYSVASKIHSVSELTSALHYVQDEEMVLWKESHLLKIVIFVCCLKHYMSHTKRTAPGVDYRIRPLNNVPIDEDRKNGLQKCVLVRCWVQDCLPNRKDPPAINLPRCVVYICLNALNAFTIGAIIARIALVYAKRNTTSCNHNINLGETVLSSKCDTTGARVRCVARAPVSSFPSRSSVVPTTTKF